MPPRSPEMRQVIIDGYAKGIPVREIAAMAGTTYEGCRATASRLRLVHARAGKRVKRPPADEAQPVDQRHLNWKRARDGAAEALKAFT